MVILLHLSTLNFNSQSSDHLLSLSMSAYSIILSSSDFIFLHSFVSSANIFILLFTKQEISFTYKTNRSGPRTLPCGTPLSIELQLELSSPTLTLICLWLTKFMIHLDSDSSIPYHFSFFINLQCGTVSN